MTNPFSYSLAIRAILLVWFCTGLSQSHAQNAGARFLLWRPDAVSNSMGGTGVATSDDAFAAYFNPAGLAFGRSLTLTGSFVNPFPFFRNVAHVFAGASVSLGGAGVFALTRNVYWKGRHERRSSANKLLAKEDLLEGQWKVSYAFKMSQQFAIGASVSTFGVALAGGGTAEENDAGTTAAISFDAGFRANELLTETTWCPPEAKDLPPLVSWSDSKFQRGISVGFAVRNLGSKLSFIDKAQSDNQPGVAALGIAYTPIYSPDAGLLLAIDIEKELFEPSMLTTARMGTEVRLLQLLSARLGYVKDTFGPENSYFTWGIGLNTKYLKLNIARYNPSSIQSTWHYDGTFSLEF